MMKQTAKRQHAMIEEASEWVIRLDGDLLNRSEQQAFHDWLIVSPEHIREFLFSAATFHALEDIETPDRISVETLLSEKAPHVVPLFQQTHGAGPDSASKAEKKQYKTMKPVALIAATFLFVVAASLNFFQEDLSTQNEQQLYSTVIGEQRSISLNDGSVVYLNTGSKLRVDYKAEERSITLLEGEALFKVAHDPNRPFKVYSGTVTAEAIGTTFNVYRQSDGTDVSVVEGKVAVSTTKQVEMKPEPRSSTESYTMYEDKAPQVLLTSGQKTAINLNGEIAPVTTRKTEEIVSWRERRLIFESETLQTIVGEFNRYNKIKIIINDPSIAHIQFDGVFDADDPLAFINFLKLTGGLEAIQKSDNTILLHKPPTKKPYGTKA